MKKGTKRLLAMMLAASMILQQSSLGALASEPETTTEAVTEVTTEPVKSEAPKETQAPETKAPETAAPETPAPETPAPETPAPETPAPETPAPETAAPETQAPETTAPETEPQTTVTEAATEAVSTETETEAASTEAATEAASTEAVTEAVSEPETAVTELVTEPASESETETEAVSETEKETESETETETESETEEPKTEFKYEDSRVIITATAQKAANLPQDAEIHADYMAPGTPEYEAAAAALEAAYAGEDVVLDYVFYDVYFTAASAGAGRIEPENGTVSVSMRFKEPVLDVPEDVEVESYEVVHVENGQVETVTDSVQTTGDGSVASVGFTSDSFSPIGTMLVGKLTAPIVRARDPFEKLEEAVDVNAASNATVTNFSITKDGNGYVQFDAGSTGYRVEFGVSINGTLGDPYQVYYVDVSQLENYFDINTENIPFSSSAPGEITRNGEVMGHWYVDKESGKVYFVFDSTPANAYKPSATLYFEASAKSSVSDQKVDADVNIGGQTYEFEWRPQRSGLQVEKEGTLVAESQDTYTFTVTVTSTDGKNLIESFSDDFKFLSMVEGVNVTVTDPSGEPIPSNTSVVDNRFVTTLETPYELKEGETLKVTYQMKIDKTKAKDGYNVAENTLRTYYKDNWDKPGYHDSNKWTETFEANKPKVEKTVTDYKQPTDAENPESAKWTITVEQGDLYLDQDNVNLTDSWNSKLMSLVKFEDVEVTITYDEIGTAGEKTPTTETKTISELMVLGAVTVDEENQNFSIDFTKFGISNITKCEFTYSTNVSMQGIPAGKQETVTNTVTVEENGTPTDSDNKDITVSNTGTSGLGIEKTHTSVTGVSGKDGIRKVEWVSKVTVKAGTYKDLEFTDTLSCVQGDNADGVYLNWFDVSNLGLDDLTKNSIITAFDISGEVPEGFSVDQFQLEATTASGLNRFGETTYRGFKLTLVPCGTKNEITFTEDITITLHYVSYFDEDVAKKIASWQGKIELVNTANITNGTDTETATDSLTSGFVSGGVDKKTFGTSDNAEGIITWNVAVRADILIASYYNAQTKKWTWPDRIYFTDVLPENMELHTFSNGNGNDAVKVGYNNSGNAYAQPYLAVPVADQYVQVHNRNLTVDILGALQEIYKNGEEPSTNDIYFIYQTKIDDYEKYLKGGAKDYKNSVVLHIGDALTYTASASATLTPGGDFKKSNTTVNNGYAQFLIDGFGTLAKNLLDDYPGKYQTIKLVDEYGSALRYDSAQFDAQYNGVAIPEGNTAADAYYIVNEDTHTIEFYIKADTVTNNSQITYKLRAVPTGEPTTSLTNTVWLEGYESLRKETVVSQSASGAHGDFTAVYMSIYKIGKYTDNEEEKQEDLKGIGFTLNSAELVDGKLQYNEPALDTVKTLKDGRVSFDEPLEFNKLYAVVEDKNTTPDLYQVSAPKYLMFYNSDASDAPNEETVRNYRELGVEIIDVTEQATTQNLTDIPYTLNVVNYEKEDTTGQLTVSKVVSKPDGVTEDNGGVYTVTVTTTADLSGATIEATKMPGDESVELTDKTDNSFKFTITGDQSVTVSGLPLGDYTVTETVGTDASYSATYEVTDETLDDDATSATVTVTDSVIPEVTITNTYEAPKGSLTLTKTVSGDADTTGKTFYFVVKDAAGNYYYIDPTDGETKASTESKTVAVTLGASVTLTDLPLGDYTVTENQADAAIEKYTLTVTGEKDEDNKITVDADGESVTINNDYQRDKGSLKLTKIVAGATAAAAGKTFKFTVHDSNGTYYGLNGEVNTENPIEIEVPANDVNGVVLENLPTGTYTVAEVEEGREATGYTLEVTGGGEVTVAKDTQATSTITNTYTDVEVEWSIEGTKTLTKDGVDQSLTQGQFTFTLVPDMTPTDRATTGDPVSAGGIQAQNDAEGNITFGPITFTQAGTYYYTIEEVPLTTGNILCDTTTYTVKVEVAEDPATKELQATHTITKHTKSAEGTTDTSETTISFENTETTDALVSIGGKKTVNNVAPTTAQKFTFTLTPEEGNPEDDPLTGRSLTVQNNGETFTFEEQLRFTSTSAGKTYNYRLTETKGSDAGYTYDETTYKIAITVTEEDGKLTASKTIYKYEKDAQTGTEVDDIIFRNTYTPNPTSVNLEATKTLTGEGKELKGGQFDFTLTAGAANPANGADLTDADTNPSNADPATGQTKATVDFGTIKFTKAGTYTFTVKENVPEEGDENYDSTITYDNTEYTVTYVVEDVNGQLTVKSTTITAQKDGKQVSPAPTEVAFTNQYAPAEATWQLTATKELLDTTAATAGSKKALAAEDYQFTIALEDAETYTNGEVVMPSDTSASNEANGNITFGEITFTKAGTYTFTVTETQGSEDHITYDTTVYTVEVTVTDENGKLEVTETEITAKKGTASLGSKDEVKFVNEYKAADATLALDVTKKLEGENAQLSAGKFSFTLTEDSKNPASVLEDGPVTVSNGVEADATKVDFGTLTFTKAGTYTFTVKENAPKEDDENYDSTITYDDTVYTVTVVVTDKNGKLTANVEEITPTQEGQTGNAIQLVNTYKAKAGEITLSAKKEYTKALAGNEFTFKLTQVDSADVQTAKPVEGGATDEAKNAAGGTVTFQKLTYEKAGTYYYLIEEVNEAKGGVTYDTAKYIVTVTVTDANGQLTASADPTAAAVIFKNTYAATGSLELAAQKRMAKEGTALGTYTFELKDDKGETLQTKTNDGKGEVKFDAISYTLADVGTKTYTVSEKKADEAGAILYDETVYTVTVNISDKGDGTLNVTKTITPAEKLAGDVMVFTNDTTTVKFDKVDEKGEKLTGAVLTVKEGEKEIASWTTDGTLHDLTGILETGKTYTLEETSAPKGYAVAAPVTFTIDKDGKVLVDGKEAADNLIVMTDTSLKLHVNKVETGSGEEVDGATLTLYDKETGEKVDSWTSKAGETHDFGDKLEAGKTYVLKEEVAPEGYAYTTDIEFTVDKDGKVTTTASSTKDEQGNDVYLVEDAPLKLHVNKVETGSGEEVDGATLTLYDKETGEKVDSWTSKAGETHDFGDKLEAGKTYVLKEEVAPEGYAYTTDIEFTVDKDGKVTTTASSTKDAQGNDVYLVEDDINTVNILKVNEAGEAVSGAKLVVKDAAGKVTDSWTTDGKPHTMTKVPVGRYTLSELEAPQGYEVSEDVAFEVTGHETEKPITVTMTDKAIPESQKGTISVTKAVTVLNLEAEASLRSGTFYVALFSDAAMTKRVSPVKTITFSGQHAVTVTFENLAAGTYYVGETNEYGELIESGELDGAAYTPYFTDDNHAVTLSTSTASGELEFENMFLEFTDGFYISGELTITKRVLKNGKAEKSNDTFYAMIFEDKELTRSYNGENEVIALQMNGSSTASYTKTKIFIGEDPGDSVTYYVAETDENGNVLNPDEVLEYNISIDKTEVTLTGSNPSAEVVITNDFIEEEETETETETETEEEETETEKETEKKAVRTGDDTNYMIYLLLLAISAGTCGVVITTKRRKDRAEK